MGFARALRGLGAAVLLSLASCASYTALSTSDLGEVDREVARAPQQYLRLSYFVMPFFGDATKRLLSPLRPEEIQLLESPDHRLIPPGRVERVLPAGTRVRVERVEFPTSLNVAVRVAYSPRTQPWVYLSLQTAPDAQPLVLVLRPNLRTKAEVLAELEQYLSHEDIAPRMAKYGQAVQEGVRTKHAVVDMPAEALEAAWGYPERKDIRYEAGVRLETWTYPLALRKAFLSDGRLLRVEGDRL